MAKQGNLAANLARTQARQFAAINASKVSLDTLNPKDIHDSDSKAVAAVIQ